MSENSSIRFKSVRKQNSLTQIQIAKLLGISQGTVTDIERGKIGVSKSVAEKLNKKLGVNTGWILAGEGEKTKDNMQGKNTGLNTGLDGISSGNFADNTVNLMIEASKEKYKRLEYYRLIMNELESEQSNLIDLYNAPVEILTDIDHLKNMLVYTIQLFENERVTKIDTYDAYKENFYNNLEKLKPYEKELLTLKKALSDYISKVELLKNLE